ncbi:MAG: hypothetical protein QW597_04975 [Thermoplasmataceae archaeon]
MSGDRFNYYLKLILNASLDEYHLISEQLQNDPQVTMAEVEELDRLINRYMSVYNKFDLKVVNSVSGIEEFPPQTSLDNFGGSSEFVGTETMFDLEWKVYIPKGNFTNSPIKKWYYNENISTILDEVLAAVVPGHFKNYFDVPPWVLGTIYAPGTIYVQLYDLVNSAISKSVISGWDYLVEKGMPRELVDAMRSEKPGYMF